MKTKLIPKILKTSTSEGDITIVRRNYLRDQIAALNNQVREFDPFSSSLKQAVTNSEFVGLLIGCVKKFKHELSNYMDSQDQYNS